MPVPMHTLELRPVASIHGSQPVRFIISVAFLQVESGQPYMRMRVPLDKVTFDCGSFALQAEPVVKVTAGDDNLWWEITLWPDEAQELQHYVDDAINRMKSL